MSKLNTLTYIIVTWNNENEIEDCLKTIQHYSPRDSKIIVVDNKSSDETISIIKAKFSTVQLIESQENLGFAGANNLALEYVTTEYLCYINPDVILTEDIITPAIHKLSSDPSVGLVASSLKNSDGTHQPSCFNFSSPLSMFSEVLHLGRLVPNKLRKKYFLNYYLPEEDFYPDWVIGAEMVLRTQDAKEIGGFSTDYFMYTEDMDICKKLRIQLNKSIFYMASSSLIHIGGASESQNVNYSKQQKLYENTRAFVRKFDGEKQAKNTIFLMKSAYVIRKIILKIVYHKENRKFQLEKTEQAIKMLKELV